jgi:hypothetical protein
MTPILPHLLPFTTPHLSFFLPSTPSLSLPSPHYSISTPVYRLGDRRVRVSVPYEQQGGGDAEAVRPHARVLRPSHQVICHAYYNTLLIAPTNSPSPCQPLSENHPCL